MSSATRSRSARGVVVALLEDRELERAGGDVELVRGVHGGEIIAEARGEREVLGGDSVGHGGLEARASGGGVGVDGRGGRRGRLAGGATRDQRAAGRTRGAGRETGDAERRKGGAGARHVRGDGAETRGEV